MSHASPVGMRLVGAGIPGFESSASVGYLVCVTVVQTLLVFVGIPAAIIALIFLAVYGKSMMRQPNRYRPGRPWTFPAGWYVPHPDAVLQGQRPAGSNDSTTAVGGASGEW